MAVSNRPAQRTQWRCRRLRRSIARCLLLLPACSFAQTSGPTDWKGYASVGPIAYPKYTSGKGTETILAPLISVEYKETAYLDIVRAGVRLWSSGDRKMALGLAAEPRFGFKAGGGPRLTGMAARRDSIELGPAFEWETPVASINLAYFGDVTNSSKGASLRGTIYRQLVDSPRWDFGLNAGFDHINARVANYYFGVGPGEVTVARALYQPGATTHWSLGGSGAYKFGGSYVLMFGLQATRLGSAATASPIAETRGAVLGYVGLGWSL